VSNGIIEGIAASPGMAEGVARVVLDPSQLDDFEPDDVLICELTDPAWAPILQLAAAVVIDIGSALSHGAIVARELGIPAVIGTGDGTRRIPHGSRVRVDGTTGQVTLL
jgi:pyruvate,water dikinase